MVIGLETNKYLFLLLSYEKDTIISNYFNNTIEDNYAISSLSIAYKYLYYLKNEE